ncbi:MAG TPA: SprT family zinc-dependent metalloprotease [Chitinophagaceae bacterium]|nr:SprT family zinc-dependent metalloprotease [Chitinophagaceae bacterium]
MKQQIKFGDRLIDFDLELSKRASLSIKVTPDGLVRVLAPENIKQIELLQKIKAKGAWVIEQLDHFNSFRPLMPSRRFINGETHLYIGRQYRLRIVSNDQNVVKAYGGQLWIYTTKTSLKALEEILYKWYKEKATALFQKIFLEVLPKFKRYNIGLPPVIIRKMATRWGSCSPNGVITLNIELIKVPRGCIEYVIIHELCHLVHYNHTKAFFDLQVKLMPDWKKWKERLEHALT